MFVDAGDRIAENPARLHYGVAVCDVDGDGAFEAFVAGFGSANRVLKWDGSQLIDVADAVLADPERRAIGVAAGDIDGDGREEIYVLNTDTFAGRKRFGDRLFACQNSWWRDLFGEAANAEALNLTAGRSVAALDRKGDGRYGFLVANYGGPMRLYELDQNGRLVDAAGEAGVALVTGGRGLVAGPLVGGGPDVFAANERGPNFLFRHIGGGQFIEAAQAWGVADRRENGRGVALFDAGTGFGLVWGNWDGPHRMMVREANRPYQDITPRAMACPSLVRTVIAADFDNDGYEELFFNNIGQENRLFGWREGQWIALDPAAAAEPSGFGTGAAVADFDGDGSLELLVSHGESGAQPLALYQSPANANFWLRVLPLTRQGAPARGAVVTLAAGGRRQRRCIDGGSGYLCQMEPVAHFGLGVIGDIEHIEVRWPDGTAAAVAHPEPCQVLRVAYPR
ncbi:CRTAC1 family protein [Gloeobacter morelensis]|uniref:CRTAC1 family protein n=1 Tax=Gloeobacter morelensis MG652769 TaxID=2781736 RepID=A0ABY3PSX8_9CYAN|nr:CRTAC1 family protein [Gloeobacter morelensis]UFP96724.1 CRTAC1 family protein [Gloeobacter morelensis MG652769]